ncbi:pre-mRNA splicing factor component-domain-containing protein [Protomyces lactucae-debilis]|uniref:Pre-mRNA splicing factor component-domain-containing protein n=1 Tax=Protomyces lactucae-debilis TaxID=2754530 RepID=A0A1Y2F2N6_PROLT|nr:pre-mRNA splicing factor component-domain-containing protein [Protomyces lactucae-debilis]ORY78150.1 pre-mRNA splicing factor component-domain-containing protein [Protomyces lactucae-debilis]
MESIKGGVWKNVEDEILKAAISKYGKNQWARISSLLVRKTAKQCKARWYEWLDPSIKKIEWTKDEDEKLLHLAKLLPTQWRTIAPIVGRTSTQCLERYQQLLDDAEAAENNELGLAGPGMESSAPTADSVRKLRPGEVDPDPETKPAKPDAIDMDEDEKEMLSEARARLANTQGKKAKRKQRERLLEETKRLSVIAKRRELKAAGVNIKLNWRKKGVLDYNADIPFEHKPALGFYDTTEENEVNEHERSKMDFRQIEALRKKEEDMLAERKAQQGTKRDKDAQAEPDKLDANSTAAALERLRKAEQVTKRRKLNLPGPQVSDQEIEEIVKMGMTSRAAGEAARLDDASNQASRDLVASDYGPIGSSQPIRTPRTPAAQDTILNEANNLRAMTNTQSSLLGGENTPIYGRTDGTGYSGATPRAHASATPHPMRAPTSGPRRAGMTPLRTPQRDMLQLLHLRDAFASLPAPKNDFELEEPEEMEQEAVVELSAEDAEARDARLAREREAADAARRAKQSQVMQRALPRPLNVDYPAFLAETPKNPSELIRLEMARLLAFDARRYPISREVKQIVPKEALGIDREIDVEAMEAARALIAAEMQGEPKDLFADRPSFTAAALPGLQHYDDEQDQVEAAKEVFLPALQDNLAKDANDAAKLDKKCQVRLGGYLSRATMLSAKMTEAAAALTEARMTLETFRYLKVNEGAAIQTRTESLEVDVAALMRARNEGQARFVVLQEKKESLASQ